MQCPPSRPCLNPAAGIKNMTKSELIIRLHERNPHLLLRDVDRIVTTMFDEITAAMARGGRVELRGFGAFSVRHREARTGRNPRTGDQVEVRAKFAPFFKTGLDLHAHINGRKRTDELD